MRIQTDNLFPYMCEGSVVANNDPDQMGRVKVWIPAVDGEKYDVNTLPWAQYSSPLLGVTTDYIVGREQDKRSGPVPYGFWAIPKVNSLVLVLFLNGDPNRRYYIGNVAPLHGNRGLPGGRNVNPDNGNSVGPWTDSYDALEPAFSNLRAAFNGQVDTPQAKSRGAYERQAAQAQTTKDGKEGYSTNSVDLGNLDPQTYCWTTPGGSYLTMVDDPKHCRMRLKTISGNQMILDDTNERIYISTAKGGTWIELDEDGHLHIYANESFSVSAGGDINFTAGKKFNVLSKDGINLKTAGPVNIESDAGMEISIAQSIHATACKEIHLLAEGGNVVVSGTNINLNTGSATAAKLADSPSIQPAHEPWSRPASKIKRNPFWSE